LCVFEVMRGLLLESYTASTAPAADVLESYVSLGVMVRPFGALAV